MKERPILFSGEMVRAILAGQKTQTRRIAKIENTEDINLYEVVCNGSVHYRRPAGDTILEDARRTPGYSVRTVIDGLIEKCPYGKVGDCLWVREKTSAMKSGGLWGDWSDSADARVEYLADSSADYFHLSGDQKKNFKKWENRPSIHMPRWASRITIEITRIRLERLQDISEEDAKAEGCIAGYGRIPGSKISTMMTGVDYFRNLWRAINGKKIPWSSNPFVWVIEFKRV
jgi:hypothetical protein